MWLDRVPEQAFGLTAFSASDGCENGQTIDSGTNTCGETQNSNSLNSSIEC